MSIHVTPSGGPTRPDFVAEISGIDLAQPLRSADRDAIESAINRYAVVVFRGQKLSDAQQIDFSAQFGPIHSSAQRARHQGIKHRLERTEIADISNLDHMLKATRGVDAVVHFAAFASVGGLLGAVLLKRGR